MIQPEVGKFYTCDKLTCIWLCEQVTPIGMIAGTFVDDSEESDEDGFSQPLSALGTINEVPKPKQWGTRRVYKFVPIEQPKELLANQGSRRNKTPKK
jgi:hypothetical protein